MNIEWFEPEDPGRTFGRAEKGSLLMHTEFSFRYVWLGAFTICTWKWSPPFSISLRENSGNLSTRIISMYKCIPP